MKIYLVQLALALVLLFAPGVKAAAPEMTVYKTKTCGCCGKWADVMRKGGFHVHCSRSPLDGRLSTATWRSRETAIVPYCNRQ